MELHIDDKLEFNTINETRVYVSKTNRACTKSSTFTVIFVGGKVDSSFENLENRVGTGLKLFNTDLNRLEKVGLENINKYDLI
jgi:hypothetical protein